MIDDKIWRLNNLYRVVSKDGNSVPFRLNDIQKQVVINKHKRKLILKARQLGMTTLCVINLLDDVLFTPNFSAGIVSYSLEHASHIFKKIIGHALDTFPEDYKPYLGIESRSAREISLNNGSYLRVDTSLRGGTYQSILVSEFGKTCARSPQKSEEVVSGTLNSVPIEGSVTIESTGEGTDGYFSELCMSAIQRGDENLSPLEYQLLFFPWMDDPGYQINQNNITMSVDQADYFDGLEEELGITINQFQRLWYCHQQSVLGDKIKQEFPSTPMEAFLSRSDAYYFSEYVEKAYNENRCLHTSVYDPVQPVYVSMDIGVNDLTVMIFFQHVHGEIRVIDYYEDSNKDIDFYCKFLLQDKPYLYHTIYLPHDSVKRDPLDVVNSVEREFRRLFSGTATRFYVLPRTDKQEQISHAKIKFGRCVFAIGKVKPLLDQVSKYRKRWHEPTGRYLEEPLHNIASNYADAFMYMCQGVGYVERSTDGTRALEMHKKAVENRRRVI